MYFFFLLYFFNLGKILEDEKKILDYDIEESKFVVLMVTKVSNTNMKNICFMQLKKQVIWDILDICFVKMPSKLKIKILLTYRPCKIICLIKNIFKYNWGKC